MTKDTDNYTPLVLGVLIVLSVLSSFGIQEIAGNRHGHVHEARLKRERPKHAQEHTEERDLAWKPVDFGELRLL
jgi:hypothetical protein